MKLTCGLTTHSYDYIHFNDHKDAYDAMINNPTNEIIKKKKASIDSKVKAMNKSLSKIFSNATGKTSSFFGDTKVDSETGVVRPVPREYLGVTDYNNFILGESGIAGVENLAVQLLKRPGELNKTINEINNLKTISGQGKMQALRKFISLFGGEIQLLKDGEDVLVGLVPNESFSSNGLQPLSIQKIDEMLATTQAAQGELKLMSDNQEQLKGAAGEISAGLFAAVALKAEKDAYLKIENKGLKKLRETSKFKANIDTKRFQGMIDQKQKELNRIGSILNKVDADTKLVKIKSTFDQQGKIDVSVGDLNISVKNYWSDNPFELGEMNIAGLMNLVSAYYPKYGWNTLNYHIFINTLASNWSISDKMNQLKDTYLKMFKNILIGYDIDILFLSRYGIPKFYNAYKIYEEDSSAGIVFKLYGKQKFENKWVDDSRLSNTNDALSRSERVWYNIMSSQFRVQQSGSVK